MRFLFCTAYHTYKGTLVASVNNCRALVLMCKKLFVWHHLLAPLVTVTAPEHQLAEKVSGHSIYPIKLTLVSAEWTGVWILLEPMGLTVTT